MGTSGSVAFQFNETGIICFKPGVDADNIMEIAVDAGAEDVIVEDDGSVEVLTLPGDLPTVRNALTEAGLKPESAEVTQRAESTVALNDDDTLKLVKLIDMLEDLDDTQEVYSNAEFSEAALEEL